MNKENVIKIIVYFLIPIQLILFTFLVPPFQKPDEQQHFEKSLTMSKGYFSCRKNSGNTVPIEKKYFDLIKNPYLDSMTHTKTAKLPLNLFLNDLLSTRQNNRMVIYNVDHLCSFPLISYLPQSLVLMITNWLNISPYIEIYLVRLIMAAISYLWFLLLFRKISHNYKLILLFTFALPMTLHQVSSFSYDVANIMLALTFFTMIADYQMKKRINLNQTIKIFFVLFLFLWSKKIGYEPFFLLLFLIPIDSKSFIISTVLLLPLYFLSKLNGLHDVQYVLTQHVLNPISQAQYLLNPINLMKVVISTTVHRTAFYLQSLIGIFGWLEYGLDPLSYFLYAILFVYLVTNTKTPDKLRFNQKKCALLIFVLIISYIFIILLAFVFNTASGQMIAQGVQGRYFIPLLPFVLLLILQIKDSPVFKKILFWVMIIFLAFSTFYSIFHRYY